MRKKTKRFTALTLVVTMLSSIFNGMNVVNATENESVNDFGYVMYATSYEEGAISLSASNICINGDLMTNGTIDYVGNSNHNGKKVTANNEPYYFIYDKVDKNYFHENYKKYEGDTSIKDTNLNLNNAMLVYGELALVGNVNLNSYIQSMGELNISGNTLNANNTVIMSKYNDINISSENVSITGLIYAPLGVVNIDANNCNLNNVIIIASKINIQCGNLNVNYNSNTQKGDYGLEQRGCRLIATSDLFLYLSERNSKYKIDELEKIDVEKGKTYEYKEYYEYVEKIRDSYGMIPLWGIHGKSLENFIQDHSDEYNFGWNVEFIMSKDDPENLIKGMLKRDIPVILLIGLSFKEKMTLYEEMNGSEENIAKTNMHYVMIVGMYNDMLKDEIWLEVSSWGKKYYIDYEEYQNYVKNGINRNWTTDIIYISED